MKLSPSHQFTPCPRALSSTPSSEMASEMAKAVTASHLARDATHPLLKQKGWMNKEAFLALASVCQHALLVNTSCKSQSQSLPRNAGTVISIASVWARPISCRITFLHAADVILNTRAIHFALHATHVLGSRLFCWQFWECCGYNAPIWVAPSE